MKGFEDIKDESEAIRLYGRKDRTPATMPIPASQMAQDVTSDASKAVGRGKGHKFKAKPCIVTSDLSLFTLEDIEQLEAARPSESPASTKRARASLKERASLQNIDGIWFGSLKEGRRWIELNHMQTAGVIRGLARQVSYVCMVENEAIGSWVADFVYRQCEEYLPASVHRFELWPQVVEDCKGVRTPLYKWKKRHVEAQYGFTIRET